jgi:hypothetical protein
MRREKEPFDVETMYCLTGLGTEPYNCACSEQCVQRSWRIPSGETIVWGCALLSWLPFWDNTYPLVIGYVSSEAVF